MTIYLIGVDHRIQWIPKCSNPRWEQVLNKFIEFIHQKSSLYRIELISEEFSESILTDNPEDNPAKDSTARYAAQKIGILHLFCDPDRAERDKLEIDNECDLREQEWLRRLNNSGNERIMFICGDKHLVSFESLLVNSGHKTIILGQNWGHGWELIN